MRVINPEALLLDSANVNPYQFIERIGRTCYKSTDKITEDSAYKFVDGLCNRKHYAMLEHYWVHIVTNYELKEVELAFKSLAVNTLSNLGGLTDLVKFVHVTDTDRSIYISAPLRVFLELNDMLTECKQLHIRFPIVVQSFMYHVAMAFPNMFDVGIYQENLPTYLKSRLTIIPDQKDFIDRIKTEMYLTDDAIVDKEVMKHRTHTVLFVCDRGVSHELVRHRPCSFAQESTRYCNYSNNKFGNELTFIKPCFFEEGNADYLDWECACRESQYRYFKLIKEGAKPQEARSVLPNSIKTEVIVTANEKEWQHIIDLRYKGTTGSPHPQMKEVMGFAVPQLVCASQGRLKVGE